MLSLLELICFPYWNLNAFLIGIELLSLLELNCFPYWNKIRFLIGMREQKYPLMRFFLNGNVHILGIFPDGNVRILGAFSCSSGTCRAVRLGKKTATPVPALRYIYGKLTATPRRHVCYRCFVHASRPLTRVYVPLPPS
jgi:hypothetical protein